MRKELKIIGSRDRHVFTATFIRFGFRDGYKGPVKTAHVCPVTRFFELPEIIGNDMIDEYTYRTNCI